MSEEQSRNSIGLAGTICCRADACVGLAGACPRPTCHSERSEESGSGSEGSARFLASLGMTLGGSIAIDSICWIRLNSAPMDGAV
jgi:hypothetical protein